VLRILGLLGALTLCMTVQASTVLFDNTMVFPDGADPIATVGPIYDSFSTGANSGFLSNAEFLLSSLDPTSTAALSVDLFSSNPPDPVTGVPSVGSFIVSLGTISDSQLSAVPGIFTLSLVSNPALAANTRYWIGLTGPSSSATWNWTLDSTSQGIGSESEFFQNAGGTFPNDSGGYQMQVEVSGTPEPASLFLSGVALLTCGVILRRRSSR
jgi:hypothetical protein